MKKYIEQIVKEAVQDVLSTSLANKHLSVSKRQTYTIANWKMNQTIADAKEYVNELNVEVGINNVIIAPPYHLIYPLKQWIQQANLPVALAAQNVHWESEGSFTGEVSTEMLKDLSVSYVIIGHSERRTSGEDFDVVRKKVTQAVHQGLQVILCVGETMEERETGKTVETVVTQVVDATAELTNLSNIILAYEPIWAIGSGSSASPEQVEEIHAAIRNSLLEAKGNEAGAISILYGGSVNQENALSFAKAKEVDGALVGGASLDPAHFEKIVHAFSTEGRESH
jgi:triosephosphate isomerase